MQRAAQRGESGIGADTGSAWVQPESQARWPVSGRYIISVDDLLRVLDVQSRSSIAGRLRLPR